MKKYSYLLFLSILFTLSSCLTGGLEDLPEFEENEISGVQRVVQLVWMYQFLLPMKDLFRRQSGRNVQ